MVCKVINIATPLITKTKITYNAEFNLNYAHRYIPHDNVFFLLLFIPESGKITLLFLRIT